MAVETVIKTIGSSGRQYATLQGWEDDAPANLTTAERWDAGTFVGTFQHGETVTGVGLTAGKFLATDGASYVTFGIVTGNSASLVTLTGSTSGATCAVSAKTFTGVIWQGQCYNDSEFTVGNSVLLAISGQTVSATCYVDLTVATGQSFSDNAGVRSNALRYNVSNGVGIRSTTGYNSIITVNTNYTRLRRLQLQHDGTAGQCVTFTATLGTIRDYLSQGTTQEITLSANWTAINVLLILTGATGNGFVIYGGVTCIGCSSVRTSDRSTAGDSFYGAYGTNTMQSCTSFGFTVAAGGSWTASKNNATDQASGLPGTSNQHSVTWSAITPFTQADGTGAMDFRAIAATALAANGFLDSTNAPTDISAYVRASSPTIGHWELTAAAGRTDWAILQSQQPPLWRQGLMRR